VVVQAILHLILLLLLLRLILLLLPIVDVLQANARVNGVIAVLDLLTVELDAKVDHVLAVAVVVVTPPLILLLLRLILLLLLLPIVDALQAIARVNGVIAVLDLLTVELDAKVDLVMQLVSHRALSRELIAMAFHLYKLALL